MEPPAGATETPPDPGGPPPEPGDSAPPGSQSERPAFDRSGDTGPGPRESEDEPEAPVRRIAGTALTTSGTLVRRFRAFLRTFSLQRRVSLLTAVAVALAVAVTGLAAYLTTRVALYDQLDNKLTDLASTVAAPLARHPAAQNQLNNTRLHDISVSVVSADGSSHSLRADPTLHPGPKELSVARLGRGHSTRTATVAGGQDYRIVAVPIPDTHRALMLGESLQETDLVLRSLLLVLVIFGVAGVLWAGLAGSAVARSGLRPVRRLTAAAEHIADTDELAPIAVTGRDELSRLAESFNQMLRSLGSSRERQRQLISDAGHELRTPLTSLRTNLELLAADQRDNNLPPQARTEIFSDVSAQLAELTSLVGDLVQLARDEQVTPAPEPIDLRDVVQAALNRVRRRGPGLRFDVELNPFFLVGESDTLERAITNLLDNAVKWSPAGGTVRVQLEGDRFRVADEGPGIAEADLPHVFDRFYRSDTARNTPGTGLGLSIVAQTVSRHGGTIRAGRSAQGGAEFIIRLPGSTTPSGLDEPNPPPAQAT